MRREYDFHATAGIVFGREGAHSALNVVAVPFR
jgi:hypothetical protein